MDGTIEWPDLQGVELDMLSIFVLEGAALVIDTDCALVCSGLLLLFFGGECWETDKFMAVVRQGWESQLE